MVVWQVPVSDIDRVGALFAEQTFVSHCYQRETLPDFPYTLYTMVHAKSESECLSYVKTLAELAGTLNYKILPSLKEFKKSSMKYFRQLSLELDPLSSPVATRQPEPRQTR